MCESVRSDDCESSTTQHSSIEIEDLLAFYPDIEDENIQEHITHKKEFADLASIPTEKLQGKYYSHQLLVQRFLESYDELFLFHDTGTGKSRILDLIGEHFRRNRKKSSQIRKVLVLVRSDILKSEIEKQIVESCEDNTYEMDETCPKARKKAIRRKISEWYIIVSYQKIAKRLLKMSDEDIIRDFSGYLIFFDEVHNIRFEKDHGSMRNKTKTKTKTPKVEEKIRNEKYCKKKTYEQIYRLFHLPYNTKRVIATATPIVNDVREIGPIMNLLLPEDKNFPSDFPYETASYEDYEPYFRGRISYVRSLDTGIDIRYIGIPVTEIEGYEYKGIFPNPQIKVFPNYMSEFQNEAYLSASSNQSKNRDKTTFYHAERQSSNFVYPDGSWGTKGFKKYTNKVGNIYYPNAEFRNTLEDIDKIRKCSVKIANVIEIAEQVKGGCVYVYDNFVEASGAITIAMCFQCQGYELFNETSSVFIQRIDSKERYLKPGFKPKKRIALLTGSTSETSFNSMIELMNSPENCHGDYIKVFIASPTGNEGINLNNVVSIHIVSGDWKYSTPHQAQSRAIRSNSHDLLIKERKGRRVEVDIYYHVAISRDNPAKSIDAYLYTLAESKDRVNRRVQRFMKRVAIDSFIHSSRNIRESDKPGTIANDYFHGPHHALKHKTIVERGKMESKKLDFKTYDVYYLQESVSIILEIVLEYFKNHFSIKISQILDLIVKRNDSISTEDKNKKWNSKAKITPKKIYVYHALEQLLEKNQSIRDRFGKKCYIRKDGDVVFLVPAEDIDPLYQKYKSSYIQYSGNITAHKSVSLKELPSVKDNSITNDDMDELLEEIKRGASLCTTSKIEVCAKLFEREVIRNPGIIKDISNHLTRYFGLNVTPRNKKPANYYIFSEPKTEINKLKKKLLQRAQGRGRKPKCGRRYAKFIHFDSDTTYDWDCDTDKVIIHNLYTLQKSNTRYADKTRYFKAKGRIRIFKLTTGSSSLKDVGCWRDVTEVEAVVYSLLIQKEIQKFRQFFETKSLVYGYYLNDKALIIRNKINEDPLASEDKRRMKAGRVCSNIPPFSLIEMLKYFDVEPPSNPLIILGEDLGKQELLQYISKSKSLRDYDEVMATHSKESLFYFAQWSRTSKTLMCRTLENILRERDLIFRTI